jgi:hypothetical protein
MSRSCSVVINCQVLTLDSLFHRAFFLLEYICLIHKHIIFLGTCIFLSVDQLKNDETDFYKFTCTFTKPKFGGGFESVSACTVQVRAGMSVVPNLWPSVYI